MELSTYFRINDKAIRAKVKGIDSHVDFPRDIIAVRIAPAEDFKSGGVSASDQIRTELGPDAAAIAAFHRDPFHPHAHLVINDALHITARQSQMRFGLWHFPNPIPFAEVGSVHPVV